MNRVPSGGGAARSNMLTERSQSNGIPVHRNMLLRSAEPGVVAKLMGLEAMPALQPPPFPSNGSWRQKPLAGTTPIKVLLPQRGGRSMKSSSLEEKKMAFARHKFAGAEPLATDQAFLRSKELQDALEVLSSNRESFLKFLDDPNSLLSKNLNELRALHPPAVRSRRITVLKPSKSMNLRGERLMKDKHYLGAEEFGLDSSKARLAPPSFARRRFENSDQSTRIVVLKRNPGKLNRDVSRRSLEATESVEVAEEIARPMRRSHSDHRRDDSLLSSTVPSKFDGEECFFHVEDKSGNFSDSEIAIPYSMSSSSSFNWASRLPPESSVMREAKKRLSERLAVVASYECSSQELRHSRSTSTLAEMLAVHEVKKEEKSHGGEEEDDPRTSIACLYIGKTKGGEGGDNSSPRNLLRSKSVPVSSSTYENMNIDAPHSAIGKNSSPKEEIKPRNGKSTLKERLSSLLFSKGKKSNDKSIPSPLASSHDGLGSDAMQMPESAASPLTHQLEGGTKHCGISLKSPPSPDKIGASESSSDNQEQPSPVSVLETPFEDDTNRCALDSSQSLGSNLGVPSMRIPKHHLQPPPSEAEEQERFFFFRKLLSSAGSAFEDASTVAFSKWHSPESPLDPALLDGVTVLKRQGAKWRERRSHQRLLFNCVNSALLEMGVAATMFGSYHEWYAGRHSLCPPSSPEEAWRLLKGWFSAEEAASAEEGSGRGGNTTIDRAVWADVLAGGWTEWIWSETDTISKEIVAKLLDELVEEVSAAVSISIGRSSS